MVVTKRKKITRFEKEKSGRNENARNLIKKKTIYTRSRLAYAPLRSIIALRT